jgi:hypothetical protein
MPKKDDPYEDKQERDHLGYHKKDVQLVLAHKDIFISHIVLDFQFNIRDT